MSPRMLVGWRVLPNNILWDGVCVNDTLAFGLLCFTSFFTLINPLGVMPIFMTMTADLAERHRRRTAQKAVATAFFTLVIFAFSGEVLFGFFAITVDSFRVVGGLIFFVMGWDMLQARIGRIKLEPKQVRAYVTDISVTPLAIPMICGPGAITNAIVLMQDAITPMHQILMLVAMLVVCGLTLLILLASERLIQLLGDVGNQVMMRLMGLIVMVIAVEFLFSGLGPILQNMMANWSTPPDHHLVGENHRSGRL